MSGVARSPQHRTRPVRVAVGFGSNLGDREAHLRAGLVALSRTWQRIGQSSLYESAPVGPVEQGPFLNGVAVFETTEAPLALLERILAVELAGGRVREVRWGPRTLDLDLLLYGNETIEAPGLSIPHPELTRRRFVLEPLLEVWPDAALPDGTPLVPLLSSVQDQPMQRIGAWRGRWWWRLWSRRNLAA